MNEPLCRILYCSKNLVADDENQQKQMISSILQTARRKNAEQDVTGALFYNSGYFAQVLEGPKKAIEAIFERIQQDERHGDVTVLECSKCETRDFGEWSMAHVAPMTGMEAAVAEDTLSRAMNAPIDSGQDVLELLRSLVNQSE